MNLTDLQRNGHSMMRISVCFLLLCFWVTAAQAEPPILEAPTPSVADDSGIAADSTESPESGDGSEKASPPDDSVVADPGMSDRVMAPENEEVAPEHFPRIRVFGPEFQEKVALWMNGLSRVGQVSWWSADVQGQEARVRVIACQGDDTDLRCFELELLNAESGCAGGAELNALCLQFPTGAPDEWAVTKAALHPRIEGSGLAAVWSSAGAPESVRQEARVQLETAFVGDVFKVAAKRMPNMFRRQRAEGSGITGMSARSQGGSRLDYRIQIHCTALLVFLLLLRWIAMSWRRLDWKRALGVVVLFGGAYALRTLFVDGGVFHENHHGYAYLAGIHQADGGTYAMPSSYILLMHFFSDWFGGGDASVFTLNAFLSALVAPLLVPLFRRVASSEEAGWLAGIAWAILPHAIRMAPTELYMSFVTCLLVASAVTLVKGLERVESEEPAWTLLVLSLGLHVLMAQSRVMTMAYPLATVALAWGAGALRTARQRKIVGWMGFVLIGMLIPQAMYLVDATLAQAERGPLIVDPLCNFTQMNHFVALNPSIVSPTLFGLAILGAAALLRRADGWSRGLEWAMGISLVLIFALGDVSANMLAPFYKATGSGVDVIIRHGSAVALGLMVMALLRRVPGMLEKDASLSRSFGALLGIGIVIGIAGSVCGVPMSRLRFEVPVSAMLCGLAGIGVMAVVGLPKLSGMRGRVAGGLLIASLAFPIHFLDTPHPDSLEYQFLMKEVVPVLHRDMKAGDVLVGFDQEEVRGHVSHRWWREQLSGVRVVDALDVGEPGTSYAVVGLSCFWDSRESERFDPERDSLAPTPHVDGAPALTADCRSALEGAQWVPLVTMEVPRDSLTGSCVHISPDVETVRMGLYRATRVSRATPEESLKKGDADGASPKSPTAPSPAAVSSDSGDDSVEP